VPDTAFLSPGLAGIADAGVTASAMPAQHSSAAASFLWFDIFVSSGYPMDMSPRWNP
jgi:hypothetical protein